jgi:hypothetical protein
MANVIKNDSKFVVCMVIRFMQAEGVNQSEIHSWLVNVHGQHVFSQKEVCMFGARNFKMVKWH